jgi:hypothetical protein
MLLEYLYHGPFTLGLQIKETPNLSNFSGQDQNVDPIKCTLWFGSKVWNTKVAALMGQTFHADSRN